MGLCAHAEFRIWEDQDGRKYDAEFSQELFGKVTLTDREGKEYRMKVEKLSELDQKYLRVMVPPAMDVLVEKDAVVLPRPWDLWHSDDATYTRITVEVTVKKISSRPFTGRLNGELFLIGREVGEPSYILLSKTDSSFLLLGREDEAVHRFKSEPQVLRLYLETNGTQRRGEQYEGYVLVISDASGNIVQIKSDMDSWISRPEVLDALRNLAVRGAASIRSRYFDKTGHKVKVPRPNAYFPDRGN